MCLEMRCISVHVYMYIQYASEKISIIWTEVEHNKTNNFCAKNQDRNLYIQAKMDDVSLTRLLKFVLHINYNVHILTKFLTARIPFFLYNAMILYLRDRIYAKNILNWKLTPYVMWTTFHNMTRLDRYCLDADGGYLYHFLCYRYI